MIKCQQFQLCKSRCATHIIIFSRVFYIMIIMIGGASSEEYGVGCLRFGVGSGGYGSGGRRLIVFIRVAGRIFNQTLNPRPKTDRLN
jgi:hypothetical protein